MITLISYLQERKRHRKPLITPPQNPSRVDDDLFKESPSPYDVPKAQLTSIPKFAVIDLQTTGLSTTEDRIIELSWLILDHDYSEIQNNSKRIFQASAGTREAKRIHHVSDEILAETGQDEREVILQLWDAIKKVPVWVFHNAHFDLSILHATLSRLFPEFVEKMMSKEIICTMTGLISEPYHNTSKYPSLIELTTQLYSYPKPILFQQSIVSLRNVYLTRACLVKLPPCIPLPTSTAFLLLEENE